MIFRKSIKVLFQISLTILFNFSIFGQSIEGSNFCHEIGNTVRYKTFNFVDYSNYFGANSYWDFSDITFDTDYDFLVVSINNLPYASELPNVNYALKYSSQRTLIQCEDSIYSIVGSGNSSSYSLHENPFAWNFPIEYGSSGYHESIQIDTGSTYINYEIEQINWFCDSYGTIVIPEDTLYNVLRIKTITTSIDSTYLTIADSSYSFITYTESYDYLSNSGRILQTYKSFYENGNAFASGGSLELELLPVGLEKLTKTRVKIYPNPTNDFIHIETPFRENYEVYIHDLRGKLINTFQGNQSELIIDMPPVNGLYFLTLTSDSFSYRNTIIKN